MATGVAFSPSHSSSSKEIVVTFEDQQKINRFARLNARKEEINDEINGKKAILTNLNDAINDVEAAELEFDEADNDGQFPVRIMEGEVFVGFSFESATKWIEMKKKETESEIEEMNRSIDTIKDEMLQLKTALYAKFGKENINLESDEQ